MSALDKMVSYFPNRSATTQSTTVNLLRLLNSRRHQSIIESLRNEPDEAKQKEIKDTLSCYTVSGVFKQRNRNGLILPSNLACVDLDEADKYDVFDLLNELKKNPFIAYCGLSCRGKRLFSIVPFTTDNYEKHYERLIQSFEDMGLPMGDSCHKVISQPRYVSYNDCNTHWFNHSAKPYHLLPVQRIYNVPTRKFISVNAIDAFQWCINQINKGHTFIAGSRHDYVVKLSRYCNIKGIPEQTTIAGCLRFVEPDFYAQEIKKIVNHVYKKHSKSHNTRPYIMAIGKNGNA